MMWLFLTAGMFFVTGSLRKNAFYLNVIGRVEPAGHPGDNNHVRLRSGYMFPRYSGPFVVRVNNVLQPQRAADPAARRNSTTRGSPFRRLLENQNTTLSGFAEARARAF